MQRLLIVIALLALGTPAVGATPVPRAAPGETVWVVVNHVKANKRAEFEKFLHEVFWPMGRKLGQTDAKVGKVFAQTRVLHPSKPEKSGTLAYVFLMDPLLPDGMYSIEELLKRGFPADEAAKHYKDFMGCLKGKQEVYQLTQSPD